MDMVMPPMTPKMPAPITPTQKRGKGNAELCPKRTGSRTKVRTQRIT